MAVDSPLEASQDVNPSKELASNKPDEGASFEGTTDRTKDEKKQESRANREVLDREREAAEANRQVSALNEEDGEGEEQEPLDPKNKSWCDKLTDLFMGSDEMPSAWDQLLETYDKKGFLAAAFLAVNLVSGQKKKAPEENEEREESESEQSASYDESLKELLSEFGIVPDSDPKKSFFSVARELAKEVQEKYGIPIEVTLAQSCLESNFGQSGLTQKALNCFGFKKGSAQMDSVTMETTEHIDGRDVKVDAKFRSYGSLRDSFMDYGRLLATSARYEKAFKYSNEPKRFLEEVIKGGYATDPNYVSKAEKVLQKYDVSFNKFVS